MIHEGEGLSLGLETCDYTFGIHSGFDDLQGDTPADRFLLFSLEDDAASPFSYLLQQFVPINPVARLFANSGFGSFCAYLPGGRLLQKTSGSVTGPEQSLYLAPQPLVPSTSSVQKSTSLLDRKLN